MTDPSGIVADRPGSDAFSDILDDVRLRGDRVLRTAGRATLPAARAPGALLVAVTAGQLDVALRGEETARLGPGDLALLTRGVAGRLEGDPATCWIRGELTVRSSGTGMLAAVPPVLVVRAAGAGAWLAVSLGLLGEELDRPGPGSRAMVSRILDLLFIHAVRAWAAAADADSPGWLTGARDPAVGAALTALHEDPARRWSVADLASVAFLSRTGFSERFRALTGVTPGAYLTRHRLELARARLEDGTEPVGAIARAVGYDSPSAFSRAFSAVYGESPAQRRARFPGQ